MKISAQDVGCRTEFSQWTPSNRKKGDNRIRVGTAGRGQTVRELGGAEVFN